MYLFGIVPLFVMKLLLAGGDGDIQRVRVQRVCPGGEVLLQSHVPVQVSSGTGPKTEPKRIESKTEPKRIESKRIEPNRIETNGFETKPNRNGRANALVLFLCQYRMTAVRCPTILLCAVMVYFVDIASYHVDKHERSFDGFIKRYNTIHTDRGLFGRPF